jgi:hypothetical protein
MEVCNGNPLILLHEQSRKCQSDLHVCSQSKQQQRAGHGSRFVDGSHGYESLPLFFFYRKCGCAKIKRKEIPVNPPESSLYFLLYRKSAGAFVVVVQALRSAT